MAVLVTDQNRLVGIFTERDILYRTALEGDPEAPIGELMTRELVTLRSDQRVTEAILTMTEEVAGTYSPSQFSRISGEGMLSHGSSASKFK